MRAITYYFTITSPWTYFGHGLLHEIAGRHNASIEYRPMPLGDVFEATGSLPLPKRPPLRQRYRWLELQRWRDKRAMPITFKPKYFPTDITLANRCIVAVLANGASPAKLIGRMLAGIWAEERDLGDEATVAEILAACGFGAASVIAKARTDAIGAAYATNGDKAIADGVFGAPAYLFDGELFWGQDRLELLDDMLASGRAGYRPL
jgi:2-hydroxychromene-2-carboxylate isomerase